MKTIFLAVIAMLMLSLVKTEAVVAPPGFAGFAMGSTNAVADYCAQNSLGLDILVMQNTVFGAQVAGVYRSKGNLSFTHKSDVETFFQQQLQGVFTMIAGSNYTYISKSSEFFLLYAYTYRADADKGWNVYYFITPTAYNLYLTKIGDTYYPPNTSAIKMGFMETVPYKVSGLTWGRMIVTDKAANTYRVYDPISVAADTNSVDIVGKMFFVPTSAALSGPWGPYGTKISLTSGTMKTFQIFDSTGMQVADQELPTLIGPYRTSSNTVSLQVTGGEVGRFFQVLSAPTPQGPWVVNGASQCVSPAKFLTFTANASVSSNQFFRLRSTNGVPNYR